MKHNAIFLLLTAFLTALVAAPAAAQPAPLEWPETTNVNRPWTRWWWQGSAVDEQNLTAALETYDEAGLGGVEITPIYGVAGYEEQFIDYLSPTWMDRLGHTLDEADRLDLGVDMATGTGWPFGGPWVGPEDAAKYVTHRTYELSGGERLQEPIRAQQDPLLHMIGNRVYGLGESSISSPLAQRGHGPIDIDQLEQPISENDNLQALALEQVRFPRNLPLQALVANSDDGETRVLTNAVEDSGRLDWTAPEGQWTLYAVFQGIHGKMVERAAPGGEGYALDHFSEEAVDDYLERVSEAFEGRDIEGLRSFFNDSYEVDDAQGEADWTPAFFEAFEERRGYDLRAHLPALFGEAGAEENRRVLSDYRQTISDLLLDHFTKQWDAWAENRDALVRNQAHGSPGNILDLYAASDVPEGEGRDILRFKFAASAAHVTGKPLASAEAATWLDEHFLSDLADVKASVDRYLLGGINHIVYHGTTYSPQEAPWPGWLFYAAVHFSPTNPLWTDFGALNSYVARAQSILQKGKPDNDVLLYQPIFDRYAERGQSLLVHFDGLEPFEGTTFATDAEWLHKNGYAFDFISDRQLQASKATGDGVQTEGATYQTVVMPAAQRVPLTTLETMITMAENGATVVVHHQLPEHVPGLGNLDERQAAFQELMSRLNLSDTETPGVQSASVGAGMVLLGDDLEVLLSQARIAREAMVDDGLRFVRRSREDGRDYFIVNESESKVDGWVSLATEATAAALFAPMTGETGRADLHDAGDGDSEVYLQLAPGESTILRTYDAPIDGPAYAYHKPVGDGQALDGTWDIEFTDGGPELPPDLETDELVSWTELGGEATDAFSGTATYTLSFPRPERSDADGWLLDLGAVHESARMRLNGQPVDTLIGPTYQTLIDADRLQDRNTLEVEVSNLMANRIAAMDRQGALWKRFYNVNFPARRSENRNESGLFDASSWSPRPSGLLGPVTLTPVTYF